MSRPPISEDIAATFARFYRGGSGATHTQLTAAFRKGGYLDADPFDPSLRTPNKELRVLAVLQAVTRQPAGARRVIDALLRDLRVDGHFANDSIGPEAFERVQVAFRREGWELTDGGELKHAGPINLNTGGRPALDEQLYRLQQADEDPALANWVGEGSTGSSSKVCA